MMATRKYFILFYAVVVSASLPACSKAAFAVESDGEVPFALVADLQQSRTCVDADLNVAWENDDLIYAVTTDQTWGKPYVSKTNTNDDTIADFSYSGGYFTTSSTIPSGTYTFRFAYCSEYNRSYHRGAGTTNSLYYSQSCNLADPTANIKDNDALFGQATNVSVPSGKISVQMKHVYALLKVTLKNRTGAALTLSKFDLTADDNIAGVYDISFGETPVATYSKSGHKTITVSVSNGAMAAGEDKTLYIVMGCLEHYSGEFTFTATDSNGKEYSRSNTLSDKTFAAGGVYSASFSLKSDGGGSGGGGQASCAWLELPAVTGKEDYVGTFKSGNNRNFTYYYDYSTFTSMWSAYRLYESVMTGTGRSNWAKNPDIDLAYQINIWSSSYGDYSRGHQVPNADRNGDETMHKQVFYATNSTPQIQNGFNGSVWANLESAVRGQVPDSDTLYVVTGAAFNKVGESKDVVWISPKSDTKQCPVANYFWKVLLKVKRSGTKITSASTIGFWMEHKAYSDSKYYLNCAVSVDQIETWTGFDFFVNLPDDIETAAEKNSTWTTFTGF